MTEPVRQWPYHALLALIGLCVLTCGCKTTPLDRARSKFYAGRYDEADKALASAKPKSKDKLLYLVERGLILHTAGQYLESSEVLLEAAKLVGELETISASRSLTSMVTTDRVKSYRGEEFERVLIHTYLMMNFLLLEDYERAVVEARRTLKRLDSAKDPLSQHPFARYVVALCFEILDENEDAYLEYRKVHEFLPQYQEIRTDLIRMARLLGRADEREEWEKLPGPVAEDLGKSSVVVFVQTGRGPKKVSQETFLPPSHRFALPTYVTRHSRVEDTVVKVGDRDAGRPRVLLNMNVAASHDLSQRIKKATVKEVVRKGAQEVLAQQTDNLLAQIAIRAAFFAIARADDRAWETLPRDLRLARIPLAPGTYDLSVQMLTSDGGPVDRRDFPGVTVPADRPAILNVRSVK